MIRSRVVLAVSALALSALTACNGCKGDASPAPAASGQAPLSSGAVPAPLPSVVAEALPRCRVDGARLALPGDEVVVGDGVMVPDAIFVGVIRREGPRRLASIVRASLDLASMKAIDVGVALGEDPPPSPRVHAGSVFVASYARTKAGADKGADAGTATGGMTRVLEVARVDGAALVREGSIVQQADESLAFDLAWPSGGATGAAAAPLVAWDEDAPLGAGQLLADRGVVKVQLLGGAKARVASPDTTDAEAPRLLAKRGGGYWLAWLARRPESTEDAGAAAEGPGEGRAYRWVELVVLDAKGEPTSPVRRITPEKGRVASFDLAAAVAEGGSGDARLVLLVQDEAAHSDGAGERIVRYVVGGGEKDRVESGDLLDGGVGHALVDLLTTPDDSHAPRWLAFSDLQEHTHVVPLGPSLALGAAPTAEPSLDGARVVAAGASAEVLYAVGAAGGTDAGGGRVELRRLVCR
jgi:hypothetical protein